MSRFPLRLAAGLLVAALVPAAHGAPPAILMISSTTDVLDAEQVAGVTAALHASGSLYRITQLVPADAAPAMPTPAITEAAAHSDVVVAAGAAGLAVLNQIPSSPTLARVWLSPRRRHGVDTSTRPAEAATDASPAQAATGVGGTAAAHAPDPLLLPGVAPVSLVAMPIGTLDAARRGALAARNVTVLDTPGLICTLTGAQARANYERIRYASPAPPYLFVILDGDRVDPVTGQLHAFDEQEAVNLARRILAAPDFKQLTPLVMIGPDTGRKRPGTAWMRVPAYPEETLDPVSQAFKKTLWEGGRSVQFHKYVKGRPNPFLALLGAVDAHPGSVVLMPARMTNVVALVASVVSRQHIVLYESGTMSNDERQAAEYFRREGIALAPLRAPLSLPAAPGTGWTDLAQTIPSSAQRVADAIDSLLKERRHAVD